VLAVIGDVSGKGMPAAMTVSLLVGTVRTLAHYTKSPSEILAAMNVRMLGRTAGGFTTCLVLHVNLEGSFTVANAGHIAPYISGTELNSAPALPLGIMPDQVYQLVKGTMNAQDRIVLLSDGVPEARSQTNELFGFNRLSNLTRLSAEEIANAAQRFGQEDDITVLSLSVSGASIV